MCLEASHTVDPLPVSYSFPPLYKAYSYPDAHPFFKPVQSLLGLLSATVSEGRVRPGQAEFSEEPHRILKSHTHIHT